MYAFKFNVYIITNNFYKIVFAELSVYVKLLFFFQDSNFLLNSKLKKNIVLFKIIFLS